MKNSQKGFALIVIVIIIAAVLVTIGYKYYYFVISSDQGPITTNDWQATTTKPIATTTTSTVKKLESLNIGDKIGAFTVVKKETYTQFPDTFYIEFSGQAEVTGRYSKFDYINDYYISFEADNTSQLPAVSYKGNEFTLKTFVLTNTKLAQELLPAAKIDTQYPAKIIIKDPVFQATEKDGFKQSAQLVLVK
ncbi:MAG: hypothetical protein K0S38_822 [Candidatus Paceibacter sp.]|jgi:hypothetical protein|nr:hypothetical protein [Candidatus Paceibacter sp.]